MSARAKKVNDAPNPAIKRCIDRYHDAFLARFGFKPDPRYYGRFGKDLQQLLPAWGEDEVLRLIDEFFRTRDPRVVRSDYTASAFTNLAQYLRLQPTRPDNPRTAANLDAAARAMRGRED